MVLLKTTSLKTPLPMIVAGDAAGEIVELGSNVTGWSIGDRVSIYPMVAGEGMTGETRLGTCAVLHRIPASHLDRHARRPELTSMPPACRSPMARHCA